MLEKNKIHLMDVLEGLKQLDGETAQIIIVDPPYNIGKDFGNNREKRDIEEYLEWCDKWITECIRILKPNGTMFIYGFSEILAHISTRLKLKKKWLIWHYTNKNMPTVKFWQRSHEAIICCWKDDKIFNLDDVREPYTKDFLNGSAGRKRPATIGRLSGKNAKITTYIAHKKGALPRDVIKIPTLAGSVGINERWFLCKDCNDVFHSKQKKKHKKHEIINHPTQKPVALCNKLIRSAKQEDGYVLIPFAGAGSECVSAKKFGLNFIGFELNPNYIRIAEERLIKEL